MTNNADYADFTNVYSRAMVQASGSPIVSVNAGINTQTITIDSFARSLNLLIQGSANVITLTVVGATTGFTYLNAAPVYDGGIYYLPIMTTVDTQVVITWYQVTAASISIYVVESDEPISISLFNPVSPTESTTERLLYGFPQLCAAGVTTNNHVTLDVSTKALRCTVDNPANIVWGKVIGDQSTKVYFDGFPTSSSFPTTPIPIDSSIDTSVLVAVLTQPALTANLYVVAVNTPDFSGSLAITHTMAANDLAPDQKQSLLPNQLPAVFDGTIAASAVAPLILAINNNQIRLQEISLLQYQAVATNIQLEDASGNVFYTYHFGNAVNTLIQSLHGQVARRGSQIQIRNKTAAITGSLCINVWYSLL